MSQQVQTPATPAQQKKVLTAVDKSTRALTSASEALSKTVAELSANVAALTAQQVEVAQDIEFKQSELNALSAQIETAVRENAAELKLRIRENEDTVLAELMSGRKLATITVAELQKLQQELAGLATQNQSVIDEAVKAAVAKTSQEFNAKIGNLTSEHKVSIAQLTAQAGADTRTIELLTGQIQQLRDDLNAERAARVATEESRAKATGVVVNTSGK